LYGEREFGYARLVLKTCFT